ncbi:phage tail tube protein [Acinetobacter rudis]|uniref:phage tail tube protein n=1 Tax=Acinetobacter rudis TaxID=632955 RepID=UPI003340E343
MAVVKTQGTQLFAVVDGKVEKFICLGKIGFGQDSYAKSDITCLDAESKEYERGMLDPGEGSIEIIYRDENESHDKLIELAEKGENLQWFVGSGHSKTPPTIATAGDEVELPKDRTWWSFKGYLNPAAPNDIEVDSNVGYTFTLVRNSGVKMTRREP